MNAPPAAPLADVTTIAVRVVVLLVMPGNAASVCRKKRSPKAYAPHAGQMELCQWSHYQDHRPDETAAWMKCLGVRYLPTGLSWADSFSPNALAWFDWQMTAAQDFDVTDCFTPEYRRVAPHHTRPPLVTAECAEFRAGMTRRHV